MALKTITFDNLLKRLILRSGRDTASPTVADFPDLAELLNARLQEIWDYPGGGWDFLSVTEKVVFDVGIRVTGFGTEAANQTYALTGILNSKNQYTYTGDQTIEWDGSAWNIVGSDNAADYTSTEDVATPDLVETWTATGDGASPIGSVAESDYKTIDLSDGKTVYGVWDEDPREVGTAQPLPTTTYTGNELRVRSDAPASAWYRYTPEAPDWITDDPVPTVYQMFQQAAVALAYADLLLQEGRLEAAAFDRMEAKGYRMLDELCNRYAVMQTTRMVHMSHARGSYN